MIARSITERVSRRTAMMLVSAIGAAAGLGKGGRGAAAESPALLRRAIERLGGQGRLERVGSLHWHGHAVVHAGGRDIALQVVTTVVPFDWAVSHSWPIDHGPDAARTMAIARDGGWSIRNHDVGQLDPGMAAHERAQFAIYGMMLLAPLLQPQFRVAERGEYAGFRLLQVTGKLVPDTMLYFDAEDRLAMASNRIRAADSDRFLAQRFLFSEDVVGGPFRWPRTISIEQDGKPYFDLTFAVFEAYTS